ncbi:lipopolysaccharide biosynthesis protein [Cellulomonas triticagri]|uniref:lipopolysaccharide biosynthesis protein n=1 Tax=Cellulomonas triticagri TaxID=2483352 RepID=UPI0011C38F45|nr:lipopolysaccharide biosynthesis protein [Cellulomonas triticagri]
MSRHGLLYVLGAALQGLALLVATPFATRALGTGEYGRVAVALAVAQTLVSVLAAGFPQLVLRDWERGAEGRVDARVTVGLMVVGGIGIGVLGTVAVVVLWSAGVVADPVPALAVALGSGALTCIAACQAVLRADRRPLGFIVLATSSTLGAVLVGIGATWVAPTAGAYLSGYTAVLVLLGGASLVVSRPAWPWRERERTRRGLPPALALLPHGLAMVVLLSSDTILAGTFQGADGAGTYQPAIMLGNTVFTVATALFNAWGPAVYRQPAAVRWRWMGASAVLIAVVLAGGAVCLSVTTPWLVPLFVGPGFDHTTIETLVRVVVWMGVPYALYLGCSLVLIERGRTGTLATITVTTAVGFAGAGALAAAVVGLEGLAVVKVVAHTTLFAVTWVVASRLAPVPLRGWPGAVVAVVALVSIGTALSTGPQAGLGVLLAALPVLAVTALAQLRRVRRAGPADGSVTPAG